MLKKKNLDRWGYYVKMGLLGNIRKFVGTLIKNPIKTGLVAYLIWKILKDHTKTESLFIENIKILKKQGKFELIFDTVTKSYGVVDGRSTPDKVFDFKSKPDAEKKLKQLMAGKEKVTIMNHREKLEKLSESLKEAKVPFGGKGFFIDASNASEARKKALAVLKKDPKDKRQIKHVVKVEKDLAPAMKNPFFIHAESLKEQELATDEVKEDPQNPGTDKPGITRRKRLELLLE